MSYPTFKIKPPPFPTPFYATLPAPLLLLCSSHGELLAFPPNMLCPLTSPCFTPLFPLPGKFCTIFFQRLNFLLILQNPANKSPLPDVLSRSPDTVTSLLVLSWVIVGLRCTAVSNFVCPSIPLYRELLQERDRISYIISSKLS